jgi:hypothetical protein
LPLEHALAFVHDVPAPCFGTHTLPLHQASLAQSRSCAQVVVHDAAAHWKGSQFVSVGT